MAKKTTTEDVTSPMSLIGITLNDALHLTPTDRKRLVNNVKALRQDIADVHRVIKYLCSRMDQGRDMLREFQLMDQWIQDHSEPDKRSTSDLLHDIRTIQGFRTEFRILEEEYLTPLHASVGNNQSLAFYSKDLFSVAKHLWKGCVDLYNFLGVYSEALYVERTRKWGRNE